MKLLATQESLLTPPRERTMPSTSEESRIDKSCGKAQTKTNC
jgi:hypothetical protein